MHAQLMVITWYNLHESAVTDKSTAPILKIMNIEELYNTKHTNE